MKIKYCKFFKIIFSFKKVNSLYLLIQAIYIDYFVGWAGKIRTCACQSQSLVPYRLATAQYIYIVTLFSHTEFVVRFAHTTSVATAQYINLTVSIGDFSVFPQYKIWGEYWDSNPGSPVPQTGALTNYAILTISCGHLLF